MDSFIQIVRFKIDVFGQKGYFNGCANIWSKASQFSSNFLTADKIALECKWKARRKIAKFVWYLGVNFSKISLWKKLWNNSKLLKLILVFSRNSPNFRQFPAWHFLPLWHRRGLHLAMSFSCRLFLRLQSVKDGQQTVWKDWTSKNIHFQGFVLCLKENFCKRDLLKISNKIKYFLFVVDQSFLGLSSIFRPVLVL